MASSRFNFAEAFKALTGNEPFPWQNALHGEFVQGKFRASCDLPTGLGKTSVIALWLLALAEKSNDVPRRLVYVVNRRTVVDQATDEAIKFRRQLADPRLAGLREALAGLCASRCDPPLAISTLRGQFADNGEWAADPARPAIVVGTVDMIGSRLLFSAYGRGFKSRPLHAGFLGQDVLLVHDEAHLEPAFQTLLTAIQKEQCRAKDLRRFRVMELSATSRGAEDEEPFRLTDADRENSVVRQRIDAVKSLTPHPEDDEKKVPDRIAALALAHANSGQAILIFVRKLDDLAKVAAKLADKRLLSLTGTMRGLERDKLVKHPIFQRFLPPPKADDREGGVAPEPGTVYLLCTSAGEVGVNISADHLVCDLSTYDSMAQRFGRVNRFGKGNANVDVVHPTKFDDSVPMEDRRHKTLALLQQIEQLGGSASPATLARLDANARRAAFAPDPAYRETSDILFDAWALTSVRDDLPGRPPIVEFLHGVLDPEPPQVHVAWRLDVELIQGANLAAYLRDDWLDEYPLKPHELLRDNAERVFKQLSKLANREPIENADGSRAPSRAVWILDEKGKIAVSSLARIADAGVDAIARKTVLLPPAAGGLSVNGTLDGAAVHVSALPYDVADAWFEPTVGEDDLRTPDERRLRVRIDSADPSPPSHEGMRLVLPEIRLREADDEALSSDEPEATERLWSWYTRPDAADDAGSTFARAEQRLDDHLAAAERHAIVIAERVGLFGVEAAALVLAARWHDQGKRRHVWQRSVGNLKYPELTLAKSKKPMRWRDLGGSRHEFASLLDLLDPKQDALVDFRSQLEEVRDLALHLIAAHHGRGRPHFTSAETTDANHPTTAADAVAAEVPRRFARLQRKYGRWGLAWLESLLRAADALASQAEEEGRS